MSEPTIERELTDQSLRVERGKTDAELNKRRVAIERSSDAVIVENRSAADEALQQARETADEHADAHSNPSLAEERSLALAAKLLPRDSLDALNSKAAVLARGETIERLWAESTKGSGTTFFFALPAA